MATKYSFTKGIGKYVVGAAISGLSILSYVVMTSTPELYNTPIADILSQYIKEILGGMTVGGGIAFIINFVKINYSR